MTKWIEQSHQQVLIQNVAEEEKLLLQAVGIDLVFCAWKEFYASGLEILGIDFYSYRQNS